MALDEKQMYEEGRCQVCGWPLAESREKGCVEGDCSYRPDDRRNPEECRRIQERRQWLAQRTPEQEQKP